MSTPTADIAVGGINSVAVAVAVGIPSVVLDAVKDLVTEKAEVASMASPLITRVPRA